VAPALGAPVVASASQPAAWPVAEPAVRPPVIPGQAGPADDTIGGSRTDPSRAGAAGLTQRIPGTHLAEVVGESASGRPSLSGRDGEPRTDPRGMPGPYPPPAVRPVRVPVAERDALNAYLAGLRRSLQADREASTQATGEPAPDHHDRPITAERHP
jgi:hypothetical protein